MSFRSDLESSLQHSQENWKEHQDACEHGTDAKSIDFCGLYSNVQALGDDGPCDAAYLNSSHPLGENINNLRGKIGLKGIIDQ